MIGRIYPQPVTRYWKCNDGTYTDVSDRRYACRRHGGIQSPEPVEVCSPDATAAAAGVYLVPLGEIYVNHDWFQNRKAAFSLRSVENIVQAAQTGAFRWASFDPITLWQSPDGKKYVLSGHSRTEAFTRCCNLGLKADGRDFCRIPAKIQTGISLEEAQKIAMESNTLSTRESDLERSTYYRKMLAQGTAPAEVIKSAGRMEGKEATKIIAFAYLNPSGKTWNALQALETADQTSRNNMQNIGRWIGNARRTIPALSDRHEDEIYDWLVTNKSYGTAKGQISNETDFGARLRTIIQKRTTFGVLEENLNIQNAIYQSTVELEYSAQISAAFQEVTDLDKKLKAKIRELTARGATEDQIRTITEGMEAALRRARIKYQTLVQKRSEVSEAARNELALFGLGQIVATQPPGVTLCRNSKYSTLATRPGVCSHNGGVVEKTMAKPGKKKVDPFPDVTPAPAIPFIEKIKKHSNEQKEKIQRRYQYPA